MANYEHLIAQLSSIAENPAKLDGDTRKRIIDATKLISSKLLTQSPIEQVGALNEPCVQTIDPWLLYKGSTNMNIVAAPLELDIAPGNGEARTDGPRIVGFSQQSAEAVPLSFVSHYEHESLSHSSMDTSSDQQHVQDYYSSTAELDRCHDWLPTGPDYIASLSNPVDPSSFNDNYHIPDLITTTNDPFTLDPTANVYNDFDATVPLGSRTVTNTSPISMNCGLTINGFNSSHSASHTTDIGQNARHLTSPPIDRSETSSTYLSRWSARLIPGFDIGPSILEAPVGTDSSLRREERLMLDEIQQSAFHGRTTPEVYLDSSSPNTAPNLVAIRVDLKRDLSRNQQQRLASELKATKPSSLTMRSAPRKTTNRIRKSNILPSPQKTLSPEQRRKVTEMRRRGACCICSRDRLDVSLASFYQSRIMSKQSSLQCSGPEGSCNRCTKIMGSLLASHICLTGLQIHRSKLNCTSDVSRFEGSA